ncbi:GAF domain-containing sensor histidine kinase [Solirubrobacter soli]|uniref:GAF domain-containing sensor histidine kinase n=1 Tax=Solirubrobacter soli TaxID=363832 RepID=UPI00146AC2EB|nr:GAF domain-containing protein [Solirubrobacter soli]
MTDLARLLDEQAALRRIAVLVASATERDRLFAAVAEEVGRLLGAHTASVVRFDRGDGTIVGAWTDGRTDFVSLGYRVAMTDDTASGRVYLTGRPARIDDFGGPGTVNAVLREMGLRSAIAAPVSVEGALWGSVVVGTTSDTAFPPDAESRVSAFAELVALALANADARDQLAASRKRLVEAAQVERRRLERNLHDGAQQRLVALAITLRLTERRLVRDPEFARASLNGAIAELTDALSELRELARGLHPAVLTEHGLGAALAALANRTPLPVDVTVDLDPRPAEAVEAAAYFVVAEGLTNVVRYASASLASVTARRENGSVRVEVTDDGKGGADIGAGTGLLGLVDRVEALGGSLDLHSPTGRGTTLRARLPETL